MAVIENEGLMKYIDEAGNKFIMYPITRASLVEGLDELFSEKSDTTDLQFHTANKNNPHGVTAEQVGAAPASHAEDSTIHVTADEKAVWNAKLDSFTETDPTVPAWAKTESKPTYTASEVGAYTKDEVSTLLAKKPNLNLLINWYFGDPVDTKGGYVVPPNVNYYVPDATQNFPYAGTTDRYYTVTRIDTSGSAFITVNNVAYFVPIGGGYVRGYTGGGPTINDWLGTINSITNEGIELQPVNYFHQRLNFDLNNKTFTLSVLTSDNILVTHTVTTGSDERYYVIEKDGIFLQIANVPNASGHTGYAMFYPTEETGPKRFKAAKLELGTEQTLAHQDENGNWVLNEIPNKADVLAQCSNYDPDTGAFKDTLLMPLSGGELSGALTINAPVGQGSGLTIKNSYGDIEGGQIHLDSALPNAIGIILDQYAGTFRIYGFPTADGTSYTGNGVVLNYNPVSGVMALGDRIVATIPTKIIDQVLTFNDVGSGEEQYISLGSAISSIKGLKIRVTTPSGVSVSSVEGECGKMYLSTDSVDYTIGKLFCYSNGVVCWEGDIETIYETSGAATGFTCLSKASNLVEFNPFHNKDSSAIAAINQVGIGFGSGCKTPISVRMEVWKEV